MRFLDAAMKYSS